MPHTSRVVHSKRGGRNSAWIWEPPKAVPHRRELRKHGRDTRRGQHGLRGGVQSFRKVAGVLHQQLRKRRVFPSPLFEQRPKPFGHRDVHARVQPSELRAAVFAPQRKRGVLAASGKEKGQS